MNNYNNNDCKERACSIAVFLCVISGYMGYFFEYLHIPVQWIVPNIIASLFALVIALKYSSKRLSIIDTTILLFLCGLYFISIFLFDTEYMFIVFFCTVIVPLLSVRNRFDIEFFLRLFLYFLLFLSFFSKYIFIVEYYSIEQYTMGITYLITNTVVASTIHLVLFFNIKYLPLYMLSMLFTALLFLHGVRGVIVTVLLSLVFLFYYKYLFKRKWLSYFTVGLFVFIFIIVYINLSSLNSYIYDFLDSNGYYIPSTIAKMEILEQHASIDNGRNELISNSLQLLSSDNLFWGIGMRNFPKEYFHYFGEYIEYPHNVFIQLLIECGLFLFLFSVIPVLACFFYLSSKPSNNEIYAYCLFFFSLIIPRFIVSLNPWSYNEFWIGLFAIIYYLFVNRHNLQLTPSSTST